MKIQFTSGCSLIVLINYTSVFFNVFVAKIYGETRDDENKLHPCLVEYEVLPEAEKEYDRKTAMETLKLIVKLGYEIKKK